MSFNFYLYRLHRELRNARITRRGSTTPANQVPRHTHKEYGRMIQIPLPLPEISTNLTDALISRKSAEGGDSETPLSLEEIGSLLGHGLGARESKHRNYPSGGALYPVETYLISAGLAGEIPGVYHYNPTNHHLERMWGTPTDFTIKHLGRHPETLFFSNLLVFTAFWARSSAKYGDLAYQHALIEAGHMSQNILLLATAIGVQARPYAGFDDDAISTMLDLREGEESVVHSITLSKHV